jgi:hypothetical protein
LKILIDCIRKTWKKRENSGKIWENPENSRKCSEKIGQNRTK